MKKEQKAVIKEELTNYLKSKGLPNGNHNAIVNELPNMWKLLESKGLLKTYTDKGFTYKHFVDIALQKKHEAEIIEAFGNKFGFRFGGR